MKGPHRPIGTITIREGVTGKQVIGRAIFFIFPGMALLVALACGGLARAQQPPASSQQPSSQQPSPPQQPPAPVAPMPEETQKNPVAPCVQPAPLVSWQDYNGPFEKVVGAFARKLERKSVHPPRYKPGAVLCTLATKDKFLLFVQDTLDPISFLNAGFNAGLDQAENTDAAFGQGAAGYGKRFGADFADQASGGFFKYFVYPTIFSEDPRYYRLAQGRGGKRLLHAAEHLFVAHQESGKQMFNFSEWLGTTSASVLSNVYHPGNKRGFAPAAERVGYSFANDFGFDVLREFWPEIARKFKLPFRGREEPTTTPATK